MGLITKSIETWTRMIMKVGANFRVSTRVPRFAVPARWTHKHNAYIVNANREYIVRSEEDIINQISPLLKAYEKDGNLKIFRANEEFATEPGENFLSNVFRIQVFGQRGDGDQYENSLIRKVPVTDEAFKNAIRSDGLFKNEAHMYENLLPLWGKVGPQCISSKPNELILEDLVRKGFKTCGLRDFLDIEHCMVVTQILASMHAQSLSVKLQYPRLFEKMVGPLKENVFPDDDGPSLSLHYEEAVLRALRNLQSVQPCPANVERAINFLLRYKNNVIQTMKEKLMPRADSRHADWVVTHGDPWKNNLLFEYDDNGNVANVKFVDFQIARHSSAALDFTYFLYSSARAEVIEHHLDDIVADYERYFLHSLRRHDAPLKFFSRPGWFKKELETFGSFGFFVALNSINVVFLEELGSGLSNGMGKAGDVDEIASDGGNSTEKTDRILFMIDHFIKYFRKDL